MFRILACLLIASVLMTGCNTIITREINKPVVMPKVQHFANATQVRRPVLKPVYGVVLHDKNITLSLTNAPVGQVLKAISRQAGYDLVIEQSVDVSKPVTVDFKSLDVEDALRILSDSAGFSYEIKNNILWVFKNKQGTFVFKIPIVNVKREFSLSSSISSGESSGSDNDNSESSESSTESSENTGSSSSGNMDVSVSVESNYDVWEEIGRVSCALMGLESNSGQQIACRKGNMFVALNKSTGDVVVSGPIDKVQRVLKYLKHVAESLSKQVVLDVRVVEVMLDDKFVYGVDWTKEWHNVLKHNTFVVGQELTPLGGTGAFTMTVRPGLGVTNPFHFVLHFLQQYGKVKIVSSPRLLVTNDQAAVIKVGQDIQFVTSVNSQTQTETNTIGCDVQTSTYFVGVALSIVPHVNSDKSVALYVHPSVIQLGEVRRVKSACGEVYIEEPTFAVREMDTLAKVPNNGMAIIGGLISRRVEERKRLTPGLSKIPLIGTLFSGTGRVGQRTEMFVFIIPHVVTHNEQPVDFIAIE